MALTLDDVGEWYPTIVSMAKNIGGVEAQVYGVVWNYSRMKAGMCYAGQNQIAEKVGASKSTVRRCLKTLVEKGYLESMELPTKFGTNVFRVTGKAGLKTTTVAFDHQNGKTEPMDTFDVDM
jgi:DNA-binding MarR family transcriptional regulator